MKSGEEKKVVKMSRPHNTDKVFRKYSEAQELKCFQAELIKLQEFLEKSGKKMVVIFEGRDAAGKGGTIKRVLQYLNPKHCRTIALPKPSTKEEGQLYFQRYLKHLPTSGEIVLFDRSWYNRAMVEPVFGFCTDEQYKIFMKQVPSVEKLIQSDGNTIFIKLYFSVTKKEQKKRFAKRKTDPRKKWKLSEVDLQAQELWDKFTEVKYKMLKLTSTNRSPWTIIRSDNKHLARREAMKVILNSIDYKGRNKKLDYCLDPEIVVSGFRELENMRQMRHKSGNFDE